MSEVNIAGDDWSPKSDVTELVEERLSQLESKMGRKRKEKKHPGLRHGIGRSENRYPFVRKMNYESYFVAWAKLQSVFVVCQTTA